MNHTNVDDLAEKLLIAMASATDSNGLNCPQQFGKNRSESILYAKQIAAVLLGRIDCGCADQTDCDGRCTRRLK